MVMKKTFKVPCTYMSWGKTTVTLDIPDETPKKDIRQMVISYTLNNKKDLTLPCNAEYVEDSFQIELEGEIEEITKFL